MTLDIRGSLKNTKLSSNKYVVIEELISNSIDSFLIRRNQDPSKMDLKVTVSIKLFATGPQAVLRVIIMVFSEITTDGRIPDAGDVDIDPIVGCAPRAADLAVLPVSEILHAAGVDFAGLSHRRSSSCRCFQPLSWPARERSKVLND